MRKLWCRSRCTRCMRPRHRCCWSKEGRSLKPSRYEQTNPAADKSRFANTAYACHVPTACGPIPCSVLLLAMISDGMVGCCSGGLGHGLTSLVCGVTGCNACHTACTGVVAWLPDTGSCTGSQQLLSFCQALVVLQLCRCMTGVRQLNLVVLMLSAARVW